MRVAIIGVGNLLLKDEGVGIWVIEELKKKNLDVELFDCATDPMLVLECMDGKDKVVVVDAYKGNSEPGTIYKFGVEDVKEKKLDLSLHNLTFLDVLRIGKDSFKLPQEIVIIGIEPAEIEAGIGLSDELKRKLPEIVKVVMEEVK
jgi:hydrogenase maturation protease